MPFSMPPASLVYDLCEAENAGLGSLSIVVEPKRHHHIGSCASSVRLSFQKVTRIANFFVYRKGGFSVDPPIYKASFDLLVFFFHRFGQFCGRNFADFLLLDLRRHQSQQGSHSYRAIFQILALILCDYLVSVPCRFRAHSMTFAV